MQAASSGAPVETNGIGLWELVREDWQTHDRAATVPGLHGLVLHRVVVWSAGQPAPVALAVRAVYGLLNRLLVRNVYGLEISRTTVIGRRLRIGHHQGVVLGNGVVIGNDCLLRHNVTLGMSHHDGRVEDSPRVGDGVHFGVGATVLGPVTIGDGARIGPHAVVTRDVPAGATVRAADVRVTEPRPDGAA